MSVVNALVLCSLMFVYCRYQTTVANWGLPIAAIGDMKKSPEVISPKMTTGALQWIYNMGCQLLQ